MVGLEIGADGYVVKPFSARELVARVKAVLRRTVGRAHPRPPPPPRRLDMHLSHLRDKLGAEGRRIVTVRGVGVRFEMSD